MDTGENLSGEFPDDIVELDRLLFFIYHPIHP